MNRLLFVTVVMAIALQTGCRPGGTSSRLATHSNKRSTDARSPSGALPVDPCALALLPPSGRSKVDQEIGRLQQRIPTTRQPAVLLERLGWLFVSKARESLDPGFYKLAEQCAACLDAKEPGSTAAKLLRGHVLQNLHRFREAEPLARSLVAERSLSLDYGLLGDVLMEQGNLKEAIEAYQTMVDLKPDPQAYARIAHVRWLKGDLAGAREVMRLAADATNPQAAESAAWVYTRLALYELQAGAPGAAQSACATALHLQADYPPALLLQGRIFLAADRSGEAVDCLRRAARLNPVPEYQWTLAEALRLAGRTDEARQIEDELLRTGAANDPRTFVLFLATRGQQPARAVELAERELKERADVHTHDALAWALAATGRWAEASRHSEHALAEGTEDPRLHFHAGIIAAKRGRVAEALKLLDQACQFQCLLLPSEREQLKSARLELASASGAMLGPDRRAAASNVSVP